MGSWHRILGDGRWLNDDIIDGFGHAVEEEAARWWAKGTSTPMMAVGVARPQRVVVCNLFLWNAVRDLPRGAIPPAEQRSQNDLPQWNGPLFKFVKKFQQPFSEFPGIDYFRDKFYCLDSVLIPIYFNNIHWSLCTMRPQTRTITFWDSRAAKSEEQQCKGVGPLAKIAIDFINIVTWDKFDARWGFSAKHSPQQSDASSCRFFVCTHMMSLALGLKPVYMLERMLKQRRFIAAVLKGDGFKGSEFQWEELYTNAKL